MIKYIENYAQNFRN